MNHFDTPLDHGPVRLRLGAVAGVLGILFAVARVMFSADFNENHVAGALAYADAHPAMVLLVNVCELLSFSLIAFSCVTLTGLVRGRGKWLTQIGGWGTTISFLVIAFNASGVLIASSGSFRDRSAATAVITHFEHSGQAVPLLVLLASSALWPLLLGIGLPRAGLVGWWYAGLVVAYTVLVGVVDAEGLLAVVANVLPLALVVGVWVKLLLERARVVAEPTETAEVSPRAGTAAPAATRS